MNKEVEKWQTRGGIAKNGFRKRSSKFWIFIPKQRKRSMNKRRGKKNQSKKQKMALITFLAKQSKWLERGWEEKKWRMIERVNSITSKKWLKIGWREQSFKNSLKLEQRMSRNILFLMDSFDILPTTPYLVLPLQLSTVCSKFGFPFRFTIPRRLWFLVVPSLNPNFHSPFSSWTRRRSSRDAFTSGLNDQI